jgi:hypothetical protein
MVLLCSPSWQPPECWSDKCPAISWTQEVLSCLSTLHYFIYVVSTMSIVRHTEKQCNDDLRKPQLDSIINILPHFLHLLNYSRHSVLFCSEI